MSPGRRDELNRLWQNIDAGTATADVGWVGDANHTGSSDSATFTIN